MAGASNPYDLLTYVWSDIFDLHLEFAGDESEHDQVLVQGRFESYFAINASSKESEEGPHRQGGAAPGPDIRS